MLDVQRIIDMLSKSGYTCASAEKKLGFGNGTIRRWGTNSPSIDKLYKLSYFLNVPISTLLSEELTKEESVIIEYYKRLSTEHRDYIRGKMVELYQGLEHVPVTPSVPTTSSLEPAADESPTRSIALFDMPVSAGSGQFLDSNDFQMMLVGDDVPVNTSFGVRISGDSMEPQYPNGGIAWVMRQPKIEQGQVGVFLLNGDGYCKRLRKTKDAVALVSLNPRYPPIVVREADDLRCYGLVIAVSK